MNTLYELLLHEELMEQLRLIEDNQLALLEVHDLDFEWDWLGELFLAANEGLGAFLLL